MEDQESVAQLASSKRILILGSSGSGKTTLALELGRILNIEVVHLDAYFWQPGWRSTCQEKWREEVLELVSKPAWIMDGTYESTLHLRIPAADAVVVLERPRLGCLWRVFKRKLTIDDANRPDAPAGQPVDWPFIRYIWQYPHITRPLVNDLIHKHGRGNEPIVLKRARDVARLVQRLDQNLRPEE
ncbi:MAG: hypothetical protein KDB27_29800 [Planctomycetales bacterium]|nr:hypothetical protein [Planctomycetales bacterium]